MNLKSCTAGCVFVYTFLSGGSTFSPPVCRWCWPHLAPEQISVRLFIRTNIETSVLLCWQAGWEASRRPADGVAICSEMSLAHLCFDPDLLSACLLAPAGISVKPGQSLAASRGPSSLSRASLLHRHDGKTSKQFIQATLNSFLSSETFLLSGSRIHFSFHFRLVGSRIVSGNFKWLSCVYSAVISVHSGSLVAFFVTQLSFSLVWVLCQAQQSHRLALCAAETETSLVWTTWATWTETVEKI